MGEEIAFENGWISEFQGLVTYIPNFIEIEETFCGWTDGWTYGQVDI